LQVRSTGVLPGGGLAARKRKGRRKRSVVLALGKIVSVPLGHALATGCLSLPGRPADFASRAVTANLPDQRFPCIRQSVSGQNCGGTFPTCRIPTRYKRVATFCPLPLRRIHAKGWSNGGSPRAGAKGLPGACALDTHAPRSGSGAAPAPDAHMSPGPSLVCTDACAEIKVKCANARGSQAAPQPLVHLRRWLAGRRHTHAVGGSGPTGSGARVAKRRLLGTRLHRAPWPTCLRLRRAIGTCKSSVVLFSGTLARSATLTGGELTKRSSSRHQ
jgi:hypothetical protein